MISVKIVHYKKTREYFIEFSKISNEIFQKLKITKFKALGINHLMPKFFFCFFLSLTNSTNFLPFSFFEEYNPKKLGLNFSSLKLLIK